MDYAIQLAERDEAMDHIKREQRAAAERFDTLQVRGWQCGRKLLFGWIEALWEVGVAADCRHRLPSQVLSRAILTFHIPLPLPCKLGLDVP